MLAWVTARCSGLLHCKQPAHSPTTLQGLTSTDGRQRYCDPGVLRHVTTPVLGVTGDWDLFCPPPGGLRTVMAYGGEHRRFVFLGPAYGE